MWRTGEASSSSEFSLLDSTLPTRTNIKDVTVSVNRKLAAAGVLVLSLALPIGTGVAFAEDTCQKGDDYCTPDEGPEVADSDAEVLPEETVAQPAQVEVPEAAQAPSGTLPFTGGDVVGMTVIGAGAVAVGTVLVRRSKRAGSATA